MSALGNYKPTRLLSDGYLDSQSRQIEVAIRANDLFVRRAESDGDDARLSELRTRGQQLSRRRDALRAEQERRLMEEFAAIDAARSTPDTPEH